MRCVICGKEHDEDKRECGLTKGTCSRACHQENRNRRDNVWRTKLQNIDESEKLFEHRTVAALIDEYLAIVSYPPKRGDTEEAPLVWKEYVARRVEAEKKVVKALHHYDVPVVWGARLWWVHNRPRTGILNSVSVRRADDLPWPPVPEKVPEKVAGYLMRREVENS